jgi:hypothetical protein
MPELIVATTPLSHPQDEWQGVLNLPCTFSMSTTGTGDDRRQTG